MALRFGRGQCRAVVWRTKQLRTKKLEWIRYSVACSTTTQLITCQHFDGDAINADDYIGLWIIRIEFYSVWQQKSGNWNG